MFNVPYYYPQFDAGLQVVNLGTGGPQSHMGLLAMQPRSYPTIYNVGLMGFQGENPRQVIGPSVPTYTNQFSNPYTKNNLEISGLFKNPRGGQ
jgi:hypothetical protein